MRTRVGVIRLTKLNIVRPIDGPVARVSLCNPGVFQMVFNVVYPMAPDQRRHVSINSARWLPDPGLGLAYGTNKGDLVICRPV